MKLHMRALLVLGLLALLAGCKTTEPSTTQSAQAQPTGAAYADDDWEEFEDEIEEEDHLDPLEGFNRAIFSFNDKLNDYVLRPFANGYKKVAPEGVRTGISNFFDNVRFPVRAVNQVLQGKVEDGVKETGMFLVNTTYGVLGLIDRAEEFPNLDVPAEDFGQTLGAWGIGNGPYLVVPVLGPLTLRDGVGRVGDYFLDPTSYLAEWEWEIDWSARIIDTLNSIPEQVEVYDAVTGSALDKYTAMKDAYIQLRKSKVAE